MALRHTTGERIAAPYNAVERKARSRKIREARTEEVLSFVSVRFQVLCLPHDAVRGKVRVAANIVVHPRIVGRTQRSRVLLRWWPWYG